MAHPAFHMLTNSANANKPCVKTSHSLHQNHPVTPLIRPVDKLSSTIPKMLTFTPDILRKCVGFQNAESLIRALKKTSQATVTFPNIDRIQTIDMGEVATVDKKSRNTTPLPLPNNFGDVVHGDIGYCCRTAIQGYKYALMLVDRATRFKLIFPLRNLKEDIINSFKQAMLYFPTPPIRYIFDFDHKLIGGQVKLYLTEKGGQWKQLLQEDRAKMV